jgi:nucleotide-binding universal stress UspA family protein
MAAHEENRRQRSIVCALDGSDGARVALRVAARLADELGVPLVVAHVLQPQPAASGFGPTANQLATLPLDTMQASGEALVARILDEEQLGGTRRRVVFGFPADRLADVADDEGAELMVVGSRGRRGLKAALLGSVSADLIGVARCPVLVVPPAAVAASARMGSGTHSPRSRGAAPSPAGR